MIADAKRKSKSRVSYEKVVNPITYAQGHHSQIKVARPRSRKHALGSVTPQQ